MKLFRIAALVVGTSIALLATASASAATTAPLVGAPSDCATNGFCAPALANTYGVNVKPQLRTYTPGQPMYNALVRGKVSIIVGFLTDPQLNGTRYRILRDDRGMTGADNILPIYEKGLATEYGTPLADRLNVISSNLTTRSLRGLLQRVQSGSSLDDVANEWLLLEGLAGAGPRRTGTTLRFVAQNFPESKLLARIYAYGLAAAGYDAVVTDVSGFRNVAYDQVRYGAGNVMVDYAASMTEFLNGNGGFRSPSITTTMSVLSPWLAKDDLVSARPSEARNNNVYVVTARTAAVRKLTKLSDLRTQGFKLVATRAPLSVGVVKPTTTTVSNPVLSLGSTGPEVRTVQLHLIRLGYLKGEANSTFGPQTDAAVRAFQKASGLTVDGLVGDATRTAIRRAIAKL